MSILTISIATTTATSTPYFLLLKQLFPTSLPTLISSHSNQFLFIFLKSNLLINTILKQTVNEPIKKNLSMVRGGEVLLLSSLIIN